MPQPESDPPPLSRIELLQLAQSLGVSDADVMTRAELRAAIEKAKAPAPPPREQPTTWVSVARRLLASVIERGLNLPDAAALIRGDAKLSTPPKAPPPVATVTLARIYAAQGHLDRAINTLDEVLQSDPDHELARDLRAQLDLRRQENLARDADAAAIARPVDEELTPLMPEVVLRDASAGPPRAATGDGATEPTAAREAAPAPELAPASEDGAAELMAPAFAVAERAELAAARSVAEPSEGAAPGNGGAPGNGDAAPEAALSPTSQTPPAPGASPVTEAEPAVGASASPVTEAEPAAGASASPVTETEPAVGASASPVTEAEPAAGASASPDLRAAAEAAPTLASTAEREPSAPNGIANGITHAPALGAAARPEGEPAALAPRAADGHPPAAPAPVPSPLEPSAADVGPHAPGLLLIEAAARRRYLYWELGVGSGPCWLHVVSHTPSAQGAAERRERCFPVQQQRGALRLEGVPADAVVRAKLSREPRGRPLAVAGAVRSQDSAFEERFRPHPGARLDAIAERARPVLERATPVYWDS